MKNSDHLFTKMNIDKRNMVASMFLWRRRENLRGYLVFMFILSLLWGRVEGKVRNKKFLPPSDHFLCKNDSYFEVFA